MPNPTLKTTAMTEQEFLQAIDDKLSSCDNIATPMICQRVSHPQGRQYVTNRIIDMLSRGDVDSIEACIPHIEQELDGMS